MGWSGGSGLAEELWDLVREHIPKKKREAVANSFIDLFESEDCDTMDECEQLMEDAQRPDICWDCGDEFGYGELGGGRCEDCEDED